MPPELRVAIDLDGTVADLSSAMHAAVKRPAATDEQAVDALSMRERQDRPTLRDLNLTDSQLDWAWSRVLRVKNFWTTLRETEPGIVWKINELASKRRWNVLFITTRPSSAGETTQVQSQVWLAEHGFERPSVYVIHGSRGKVAAALRLDAVVDDRPENCLDVAVESSARAILVWPGDESELPPGISREGVTVVPSIGAALDELVAIDRVKSGGVMRSLKRLIGRD